MEFESIRQQKISKLIQREISDMLLKEIKHLCKKAFLTVTKIKVSADLALAKVYISIYQVSDKKQVIDELNQHSDEIRLLLGKRIRHQIRHVPELKFYIDDTLDYIEKIETLIKPKSNP